MIKVETLKEWTDSGLVESGDCLSGNAHLLKALNPPKIMTMIQIDIPSEVHWLALSHFPFNAPELTVRQIRLKRCSIRKRLAVDALGFQASVPANACPKDTSPGDHATHGGHVRNFLQRLVDI